MFSNYDAVDIVKSIKDVVKRDVSRVVDRVFDDTLNQYVEKSHDDIMRDVNVDEHVCNVISDHLDTVPHSTRIPHPNFKNGVVSGSVDEYSDYIDRECIGRCPRCSLLYFNNVRFVKNKAMSLLSDNPLNIE